MTYQERLNQIQQQYVVNMVRCFEDSMNRRIAFFRKYRNKMWAKMVAESHANLIGWASRKD